jgi:hypothetical protein
MMLDSLDNVLRCTNCRFQLLLRVLELIPRAAYCLAYISASKILEVTFHFIPHYYLQSHLKQGRVCVCVCVCVSQTHKQK